MHCVFSYDLHAEGQRRTEIETRIQELLAPYRNVRRLSTFYIVRVQTLDEWNNLLRVMTDYSRSIPENFDFIMSPPMTGGTYNGLLPTNEWVDINEISRA